ncbi:NAD(P)-dependent dehydrogenase (short-subunit alcohol dehydrogenase family) [Leucobacter exalbidus]|uniref:NAD(P)-dependent dehydrogenase (Short-subunit alcohol dehydrogenase family) n=1 Tax=Leucobacter exalbidus TaxID=662960 RepID=A0A940PXL4_9MICO|nr:SDR family NAD(P)-dependent oxidoreductase [Leucobacter exalbidus]MBP1326036.1 NAD(P)-dependent dehydrogenase (short-subunit alcohol dehydrogenase family) [Leucobacter exalbidus]
MTQTSSGQAPATERIDPAELELFLRVLGNVHKLPDDHPDFITVRQATSAMFKAVKRERARRVRDAIANADRAVIAKTATGAADRIDDETRGVALSSSNEAVNAAANAAAIGNSVPGADSVGAAVGLAAPGSTASDVEALADGLAPSAGELIKPRNCYICKQPYTRVDAFYHQLCPTCARFSHGKRDARTDLTGKRALLTGGRAKIGMHIALRLLRDGAHLTITTRFPKDAARRFASLPDSADWIGRLRIVGIDLRDPSQVIALADSVAAQGPLDILINNAAQTVRRSPGSYSFLADAENQPLPDGPMPEIAMMGRSSQLHPQALQASVGLDPAALSAAGQEATDLSTSALSTAGLAGTVAAGLAQTLTAGDLSSLAMAPGSSSLEKHADGSAIDAGGLVPDVTDVNSWVQHVQEVDPLEMLEVQLCNTTAPFILISRLRASMVASKARRTYIVNVSAMEGQFGRRYKGPGHPHTNMAKAALNMLTRTSAGEMFTTDNILMTAVDTGWITDERPHFTKVRLAQEGFHAPLDLVDGAARVYDPIVRGEAGEDLFACFLKDYEKSPW